MDTLKASGGAPLATERSGGSRRRGFDYLIVGAGFAGSVLAERLAAGLGKRVLVVDRRPHIGGNAYDFHDDAGVLIHRYGPHIFHTNAQRIVDYLSNFTEWRPYEHRVLAQVGEQQVPIPINMTTLNALYGLQLRSEEEAAAFLASRAEPVAEIRTSEDVVINQVGRELYETFFRGYTRKQWGLDPSQLDKSVTSRVPTRTNDDDRYFTDTFQQMPLHGYTRMFERMLDHPNIKVMLNTDYREIRDEPRLRPVGVLRAHRRVLRLLLRQVAVSLVEVRTQHRGSGAVSGSGHGQLPGRGGGLHPHHRVQASHRPAAPQDQHHPRYPSAEGDPYYPIPRAENAELYRRYERLAAETPNVTFLGRLGTYKYYNMDQVVGQALALYKRIEDAEHKRRAELAA